MDALIFENKRERESLNWLIFRRAKYSTLCLCHALHESDSNKVDYTCNKCSGQAKWHCGTCDDFDLCDACYKLVQHEHKMEPIKSIIGDSGAESSTSNRFESIQVRGGKRRGTMRKMKTDCRDVSNRWCTRASAEMRIAVA